jgi:hypothetical protein
MGSHRSTLLQESAISGSADDSRRSSVPGLKPTKNNDAHPDTLSFSKRDHPKWLFFIDCKTASTCVDSLSKRPNPRNAATSLGKQLRRIPTHAKYSVTPAGHLTDRLSVLTACQMHLSDFTCIHPRYSRT